MLLLDLYFVATSLWDDNMPSAITDCFLKPCSVNPVSADVKLVETDTLQSVMTVDMPCLLVIAPSKPLCVSEL